MGGVTNAGSSAGTTAGGDDAGGLGGMAGNGNGESGGSGGARERRTCGGLTGFSCDADEYCAYVPEQHCGEDGSARCEPRPQACTAEFAPVCGCDGETHSNRCMAALVGIGIHNQGACE
jgi:hypothetical protein